MTAAAWFSLPLANARQFLNWWISELSEGVAATRRSQLWKVMFLRREGGCDVYVRTGNRAVLAGTSQLGSPPPLEKLRHRLGKRKISPAEIVLRLPPGEVVQTQLKVPAAALDALEPILRNQIERLAPWPAEKALFAYEVAAAAETGTLQVALAVAGRDLVEGLVAELDGLGYAPGVVDYGTDPEAEPRFNLLQGRSRTPHRAGRLLVSLVGVLLVGALAAGAVGSLGLLANQRELGILRAQLEELRAKASADLPGHASARLLQQQTWLAAQKLAQPSMAVVLEALSRAIPDDAWLSWLEVEQGAVRLGGYAANSTTLIAPIEASGHFTNVQFAAPTTRREGDNRESFTITAKIVPGRKLN
jgi:general secretion pathway protein L